MSATTPLPALIAEAYRLFAPCRATFPLAVCNCACCSPQDFQRELLRFPLRQIPADYLYAYLSSVPSDDQAATARDMKHFLPRILEAVTRGEDIRSLDEMRLDKLCCGLPEVWASDELDFLHRFARAWFASLLNGQNAALPAIQSADPHTTLLTFHYAGLDCTAELLAVWTQHADHPAALAAFVALWTAMPVGSSQWRERFYLPAEHHIRPERFTQPLLQWFDDPATRATFQAALETALLEDRAPADEIPLWENCYDWLGMMLKPA
ncbi:Uncharacterised protein [Kingella potus]|uniref:Uncharacterized protein n=1 Tax=Kingella potus TaxID=265175 RepID=A0A377R2U2_9NEIS|nr:hypothetical protein [Kingella potus]STR00621.1 Uncharacterised protein [Kingella potus]